MYIKLNTYLHSHLELPFLWYLRKLSKHVCYIQKQNNYTLDIYTVDKVN